MIQPLPGSTAPLSELAPFAHIRLIAVDIDGTLLTRPDATVTETIAEMNRSLHHHTRGVTVTIATGRAFHGAAPVISRLGLMKRTLSILYNGALLATPDASTVHHQGRIERDVLLSILATVLDYGLAALVYEPEASIPSVAGAPGLTERVWGYASEPGPAYEFNGLPVDWNSTLRATPATAVAALVPTPLDTPPGLLEALAGSPGVTATRSSNAYLELRPSGTDKGRALAFLGRQLGVSARETLAIGDNDNDVEMLNYAGCSVAVANATESALAASDYVAGQAAGNGVVETLRLVAEARRQRPSRK